MPVIPIVGKRYLVKKPWGTSGCKNFQDDMEKWSKTGVIPTAVDEDCEWVHVEGSLSAWVIEFDDLIPYRPLVLENK